MAVVRSKKPPSPERVDDALVAEEVAIGVARSPQLEGQTFIGLTFSGIDGERGDVVLTLELAAALVDLLAEAVAKAKLVGDSNAHTSEDREASDAAQSD